MRVQADITYPADAATVAAMLADPAFVEEYCASTGAVSHSVDVTGDAAAGFTVTTVRTMPTDRFPDVARKFVGATIDVRQTDTWEPAAADGARRGATTVEVVGTPLRLSGSLRLTPAGSGTEQTLDGDLKASVPLIGGRLEQAAEPAVMAGVRQQERVGGSWLTRP